MAHIYKIGFTAIRADGRATERKTLRVAGIDATHAHQQLDQMILKHKEESNVVCTYRRFVERKHELTVRAYPADQKQGRCRSIW